MKAIILLPLLFLSCDACASIKYAAGESFIRKNEPALCKQIRQQASEAKILFEYVIIKLCTSEGKCIELKCQL